MLSHLRYKGSIKTFIISITLLILCIYSVGISLRNLLRYNMFKQELITSEKILYEQEEIKKKYEEEITLMKLDDYWELEAKKKLGYSQADEYIYKFYTAEGF